MRSGQRMREQKRMYLCKCHSIKKKERKKYRKDLRENGKMALY